MPGYVGAIVEAEEKVMRYAAEQDQGRGWDIRSAFYENLQQAREFGPARSFPEALTQAVKTTQGEIREAAEMQWAQQKQDLDQRFTQGREAMRQHLDTGLNDWRQFINERNVHGPTPDMERLAVHNLAVKASDELARGTFPYTLPNHHLATLEHATGARKAIMDWSHEHNHELRMQLNQAPRLRMGM